MTEFSGEIHPVADLFPMLPDDELKDLAADITKRGLLQPIVLDNDGRILDGRNRYSACALAGVEPEFVSYDGDDPDGYALAVNIARRHLNKGQQAMVVAKARRVYSVNTVRALAQDQGISAARVSQANAVIEYAPDLADAVADGSKPLNEAYKTAQDRKNLAETSESQMAKLRAEAPDLADQVAEERLTLSEALAAHRERQAEAKRQRQVATHLLCEHVYTLSQANGFDLGNQYDATEVLPGRAITTTVIDDAMNALRELRDTWKDRRLG